MQIVRQGFEAWNRRDAAAGREFVTPDIEWKPSTVGVIERELDGFVNAARALWEVRDDFWFQETEIRDWGDNVLWLGHADAKRSTGQVVLDQEFAVYSPSGPERSVACSPICPTRKPSEPPDCRGGPRVHSDLEASDPRLLGPRCHDPPLLAL